MPPLFLPSTPPQTLLVVSNAAEKARSNSHRATLGTVIGFLVVSAVVTGLALVCLVLIRDRPFMAPRKLGRKRRLSDHDQTSREAVDACGNLSSLPNCFLSRNTVVGTAGKGPPGLRPLLLGRSSELSSEQQSAVLEQQRRRKRAHRTSEILIPGNRSSFPFGSSGLERQPTLSVSQSCPSILDAGPQDGASEDSNSTAPRQTFVVDRSSPFKTKLDILIELPEGCTTTRREKGPDVFLEDTENMVVASVIASRKRKHSTRSARARRMRCVHEARKRCSVKSRKRTILQLKSSDYTEEDVFGLPRTKATHDTRTKKTAKREKSSKKKISARRSSPKKQALASPRKPLGLLTNKQTPQLCTPPRPRPLLHINGLPEEEHTSSPRSLQFHPSPRSSPRSKKLLSARWRPRPARPPLTITVFVKERSSRAMYPGRRFIVKPLAGASLAELRSSIEKVAGHKVGIMKGMTMIGRTMMNVPLMSDRFYGEWVKERVSEGGMGVVEVLKMDI